MPLFSGASPYADWVSSYGFKSNVARLAARLGSRPGCGGVGLGRAGAGHQGARLSQPFVGDQALDPQVSAQRLLAVLDTLAPTGRAQFVDHLGQVVAW